MIILNYQSMFDLHAETNINHCMLMHTSENLRVTLPIHSEFKICLYSGLLSHSESFLSQQQHVGVLLQKYLSK